MKFVDAHGVDEGAIDEGGLTAEMHSSFWRQVLHPSAGLFELGDTENGFKVLPRARAGPADLIKLQRVGRVLCKSLLDDHPIGESLCSFTFDFLVDQHEQRTFGCVDDALRALADLKSDLAAEWRRYLALDSSTFESYGLTRSDFDEQDSDDSALTSETLPAAVLAGCRWQLLGCRREALAALRHGFVEFVDLSMQLAPLYTSELMLMVQGRVEIRAEELIGCFAWPDSSPDAASTAGFVDVAHAAAASNILRALFGDEASFPASRRLKLLQFCTGLRALPLGGLRTPITFQWDSQDPQDSRLPVAHTCVPQLDCPCYTRHEAAADAFEKALAGGTEGFALE